MSLSACILERFEVQIQQPSKNGDCLALRAAENVREANNVKKVPRERISLFSN